MWNVLKQLFGGKKGGQIEDGLANDFPILLNALQSGQLPTTAVGALRLLASSAVSSSPMDSALAQQALSYLLTKVS